VDGKWGLRALGVASALVFRAIWAAPPATADEPKKVRLFTGAEHNYYYDVGMALQTALRAHDVELEVIPSKGSLDNLRALETGDADFAIVQSDAAHRAWYGEWPFARPRSDVKLVAPLFIEKVQILIRPHLYISSPAELKGKKIWMGGRNSGSELSALNVLAASGFSPQDVENSRVEDLDYGMAVALLKHGKLDAVVRLSEAPPRGTRGAPLEKVEILVQPHSGIAGPADLKGQKIWMGAPTGGVDLGPLNVLEAPHFSSKTLRKENTMVERLDYPLALELLSSLRLDAIFQTSVAPTERIRKALDTSEIHLLGLDWNQVERLAANGTYTETALQSSAYRQLEERIFTIGVQALLLTREGGAPDDTVVKIAETLQRNQTEIESNLRSILHKGESEERIDPFELTLLGTRPRPELLRDNHSHRATAAFLPHWRYRQGTVRDLWILLLALFLILALIIVVHLRCVPGASHIIHGLFALAALLLWVMAAVWLREVEGELNEHFRTLPASAISLARSVGAKTPFPVDAPVLTTNEGRFANALFTWLGTVLVALVLYPWAKKVWKSQRVQAIAKWVWD